MTPLECDVGARSRQGRIAKGAYPAHSAGHARLQPTGRRAQLRPYSRRPFLGAFGNLRPRKIALRPAEPATPNRDATPASARRRNLPLPSQLCSIRLMEQQCIHCAPGEDGTPRRNGEARNLRVRERRPQGVHCERRQIGRPHWSSGRASMSAIFEENTGPRSDQNGVIDADHRRRSFKQTDA